jgi:hypothetical protein
MLQFYAILDKAEENQGIDFSLFFGNACWKHISTFFICKMVRKNLLISNFCDHT